MSLLQEGHFFLRLKLRYKEDWVSDFGPIVGINTLLKTMRTRFSPIWRVGIML